MQTQAELTDFAKYADMKAAADCPNARELAYARLNSRGTIFFDTKNHKLLSSFRNDEKTVVYALRLVVAYSLDHFHVPFKLSRDERRLLYSYCTPHDAPKARH